MRPEVSIVIPTYMRPRQTGRAIRSALLQPGVGTEIIVVDDASPEPFELPQLALDTQVRVLRLDRNVGPAGARNAGVAASTAEVIAFLDSDDFFVPGTLSRRLAAFRKLAGAGRPHLVASTVWRWAPGKLPQEFIPAEADSLAMLASGCWYFPGSTAIFAKTTWDRVGPFDERLRRLEDLDWGIRLALAGGALRVTPEPAAVIERSPRAGLRHVEAAAAVILARYGAEGPMPLPGATLARLKAYLSLEKASSAFGERRHGEFVSHLASSFAGRPRLSLHLRRWWRWRSADRAEARAIEHLARSLSA
jgi:glycosyltransferase involved in cell wall biosynthesis